MPKRKKIETLDEKNKKQKKSNFSPELVFDNSENQVHTPTQLCYDDVSLMQNSAVSEISFDDESVMLDALLWDINSIDPSQREDLFKIILANESPNQFSIIEPNSPEPLFNSSIQDAVKKHNFMNKNESQVLFKFSDERSNAVTSFNTLGQASKYNNGVSPEALKRAKLSGYEAARRGSHPADPKKLKKSFGYSEAQIQEYKRGYDEKKLFISLGIKPNSCRKK